MTLDLALEEARQDGDIWIEYVASKTLAKFHASTADVRGIMGPIGSGKSVGCCNDIMARCLQQPVSIDGVRRSRWAIVRNTYPELKETTIKTWLDWYGELTTMVYGAPITGEMDFCGSDGIRVHVELVFIAIDQPRHVKKLLSLELTGAWLNEARELPKLVLDGIFGRTGRYPAKRDCPGGYWSGVIMDTNPPDDAHWWFKLAEEDTPHNYAFFSQPPALIRHAGSRDGLIPTSYTPNPKAENVEHHTLGYHYWQRQLEGKTDEWIKVYILGQYGTVLDGRLVFTEYRDDFHCAEDPLEPIPNLPLILGWDWGRTPACVIGQLTARGQLRVIDELVVDASGEGMGVRSFARDVVKPHLASKYPGYTIALSMGDPSGVAKDGSDNSMFDILAQEGIQTIPAPTNDPGQRQDAVIQFLKRVVDGEPGYLISPACAYVRRGYLGGYRYAKMQVSAGDGVERLKPAPEKNRFSHPHDAHQHLCQAALSGNVVVANVKAKPVVARSPKGWS